MRKQSDALYFNPPPMNPTRRFHILERVHQIAIESTTSVPIKFNKILSPSQFHRADFNDRRWFLMILIQSL